MRRFFTLVCLLCLTIPAGISISGCVRNPAGNFCNGQGYGLKNTQAASITLTPVTGGISLAYGQTADLTPPVAYTCLGNPAGISSLAYTYGTTNNQLVDISPTGELCAGTWNRNTGGGIANYTICSPPNPLPSTGGLPYGSAYITASASSVTSNPVQVFVHTQVTSIGLVGPQKCISQGVTVQLDSQACYAGANNQQLLLCAPSSVTSSASPSLACPLPAGQTLASIPSCSSAIGTLQYSIGTYTVATLNSVTNQITANQPGTTSITASIAGSGSSAGYFSTCPPQSISVSLASGKTSGIVTQGVQQNLTTTVLDTSNNPITGLNLTYQSTNQIDITAGTGGAINTLFPGQASITAICEPASCNPAPINEIGTYGTGLSISSNPVTLTTPGTASDYLWFAAPGQSRYFTSIDLLNGSTGSTIRLPYVPNSMMMDQTGRNLFFGSLHELMVYDTTNNGVTALSTNVPGVVLAVSPNDAYVLVNDQVRQVFYIYYVNSGATVTFGGMGSAAAWTPDTQTLYIVDSAALNTGGVTGHTDTLYVENLNTGWSTYDLSASGGAQNLALTIPSVGAYLSGNPTVAHTWCPSGTVGNAASMLYYPQGDSVPVDTGTVTATPDGQHILGASLAGGGITLSDIGVTIPTQATGSINTPVACPMSSTGSGSTQVQTLSPLLLSHTVNPIPIAGVSNVTAIDQVVTGSLPVLATSSAQPPSLAFITYTGSTPGAKLPYYLPVANGLPGNLNYVTLMNGTSASTTVTAPLAGAFSPDNSFFFVSTAGDNEIHFISIPTTSAGVPADTKQISPNLPACSSSDQGCTNTTVPANSTVPATVITVKPRSTT